MLISEISQIMTVQYIITYIWNLKNKPVNITKQTDSQIIENKLVVTSREREGGEARKGKEIKRYRLLCMI